MFWEYPDNPLWEGETVFIVGGGPSLHDVDLGEIEEEKIIGVNESYTFGDFINFNFIGNNRYYVKHKEALAEYGGSVVCAGGLSINDPNIHTVYKSNKIMDLTAGRIGMANNSGIGAINLAVQLGAGQIVLLGFDMTVENGANWHKNNIYQNQFKRKITEKYYAKVRHDISTKVLDVVYGLGISVINCTENSALDCFPSQSLSEFLEEYRKKSQYIEEE